MLTNLLKQGCIQYIGWQCCFHCGTDQLGQLKEQQKLMSEELRLWSEAVTTARDKCYALNSYTMEQILLLRKELHPHFTATGDMKFLLAPEAISLLKCIHPCANANKIVDTLKDSWNDEEDELEMKPQVERCMSYQNSNCVKDPRENLDSITNILSKSEKAAFVKLTEKLDLDNLWVISEILSRRFRTDVEDPQNNCNEMDIVLLISESDEDPDDVELVQSIKRNLCKLGEDTLAEAFEPPSTLTENEVSNEDMISQPVENSADFTDM